MNIISFKKEGRLFCFQEEAKGIRIVGDKEKCIVGMSLDLNELDELKEWIGKLQPKTSECMAMTYDQAINAYQYWLKSAKEWRESAQSNRNEVKQLEAALENAAQIARDWDMEKDKLVRKVKKLKKRNKNYNKLLKILNHA